MTTESGGEVEFRCRIHFAVWSNLGTTLPPSFGLTAQLTRKGRCVRTWYSRNIDIVRCPRDARGTCGDRDRGPGILSTVTEQIRVG